MVEKMVATPALQLADVFPPFAWTFGKVRSRRASAATPTATSAAEAHATPRRFSRFSQRTVSAHGRARLSRVSTTPAAAAQPPAGRFFEKVVFLAARASDRARTNTHLSSSLDTLPWTPLLRCPRVTRRAT